MRHRTPAFFPIYLSVLPFSLSYSQVSNWQSRGIGGGGALFYPEVNPHNTSELYITCDMGLTFHSTDGGRLWDIVDFHRLSCGTTWRQMYVAVID